MYTRYVPVAAERPVRLKLYFAILCHCTCNINMTALKRCKTCGTSFECVSVDQISVVASAVADLVILLSF